MGGAPAFIASASAVAWFAGFVVYKMFRGKA